MKVVLFCGGMGMRIRDHAENVPKPLVNIGYRPILWHVMKYYAHYGHKDFILCLGYKGNSIKEYFLNYDECLSNDFVMSAGGKKLKLLKSDIHDWKITFVDTGLHSNIGERLWAVRGYLKGEDVFLANYSDGLSDLSLTEALAFYRRHKKMACFLGVKPTASFHIVSMDDGGLVKSIGPIASANARINGGFFILSNKIFDYIRRGEELVSEPFQRLIAKKQLIAYPYDGFWACMDTFKEKQLLEDIYVRGRAPWEVWKAKESKEARRSEE